MTAPLPAEVTLADVEARLALFAEGISGRYLHIKSSTEFSSRRFEIDPANATQTGDALFLPETVATGEAEAFRVLALQQLAAREFGSFDFRFEEARRRIAAMADVPPPDRSVRVADRTLFCRVFDAPGLVRALFDGFEAIRIDHQMTRAYPGIRRHLVRYYAALQELDTRRPEGHLDALERLRLGADIDPVFAPLATLAERVREPDASVYDSADCAAEAYAWLAPRLAMDDQELAEFEELAVEWHEREARLEDWAEELEQMEGSVLAVEMLESEGVEAQRQEEMAGEIREEALDITQLRNERDRLSRRLEMERSAIRDALGEDPAGRSFRYDEWDYLAHTYRKRYCRLFEIDLEGDPQTDIDALRSAVQTWRHAVQKQLEHIKPLGFQRVRRVQDGDEIDIDAIIEARQDTLSGHTPDDRLYSRRERMHRDVCAALLVDLSASTDDPIEPPLPPEPVASDGPVPNLRDPYDDDPYYWSSEPPEPEPKRRIIDVQQEATLIMATALDQLGDSYGVYGFSGYGHDQVEFYVAKDIRESFTPATVANIAAMRPKRSTRMGPAIRHAVTKLVSSGNAMKVLLVVSDGFPQDSDYGPERGNHEYGLEDTAKALTEAHAKGVETFCVTVDRSGHDYLKRMCPESRYMVIEEIEDLPEALSKVYASLTASRA